MSSPLSTLTQQHHKDKVIIVMGATGSGKSKLSIDLATRFSGEIINSDKIQVYKGLDIVTNKVTEEQCRGVTHHLLGMVDPDEDFTVDDFCHDVGVAVASITNKGKIPIIAGGSNSFIEALVNNDAYFKRRYEMCFLWIDVSLPVLERFISERVDRMVEAGLVDEVRAIYEVDVDYSRGVRRAIGVPELDSFFKAERDDTMDKETLDGILKEAIDQVKANTYELACRQREKIERMRDEWGWGLHHMDATKVFVKRVKQEEAIEEAWEEVVVNPSVEIVDRFLTGSVRGDEQPTCLLSISNKQSLQVQLA